MANIPTPRSFNAILGDMVDAFISKFGLKSLKRGSPILSILEAAAQSDLRSTQDTFDLLNAISLDRATGLALDRIGADEGLSRIAESAASGSVIVSDSSFTKKSTRVYQGRAAPIIGSSTIYLVDAQDFPSSGSVYLGRGTTNYEGPIAYSAKTNLGTYWSLTLSTNTKKFHNIGESVVLAQGGNRTINAGVLVQTPQGNVADAIQFSVLYSVTIPDGETSIENVLVTAQRPGIIGNVSAGAINSFVTSPFTGATVSNPLPFTNGEATEDDNTFRERIRNVRQSRSLGTPLALTTAITGITSSDENKRISSSSVVTRQGFPTTVYIDDGTGYEERSSGIAIESLTDKAIGGEQYFQLRSKPIAKAFLVSGAQAPFALTSSSQLAVFVGGVISTHTFDQSEFRSIASASAYEVVASINANSSLSFMARTSDSGTRVEILAKSDTNEDLQIAPVNGTDSNSVLLFPSNKIESLRLYKNDKLLSKDGQIASLQSQSFAQWGAPTAPATLTIDVDGTGEQTYSFLDNDFVNALTGFSTVGKNTVDAWVSVINRKIPGITARSSGGGISLISNSGFSSRASLRITGGTLVSNEFFDASESYGKDKDYTLDRNLSQIRLEVPLEAGDKLSAGTSYSRAFLSADALTTTASIGVGGGNLWFIVDGNAKNLATSLNSATQITLTLSGAKYWGNRIRLSASVSAFSNIEVGDWAILWDTEVPANSRGYFRVSEVDVSGNWVEFERKSTSAARAQHTSVRLNDGKILVAGGRAGTNIALAQVDVLNAGVWSPVAPMLSPRYGHSAVVLSDGKVLVMGGFGSAGTAIDTCEIYNPANNTWTAAASLPAARALGVAGHMSANGKVVFAGGVDTSGVASTATYVYTVSTNLWATSTAMAVSRKLATGTVFSSGSKFLVAGGDDGTTVHNSAIIYDTNLNTWSSATNTMASARTGHAASLLNDGKVFITGGSSTANMASALNTTSIFDPATASFSAGGVMATARALHSQATLAPSGQVLVAQGAGVDGSELSNSSGASWTNVTGPMPLDVARSQATLTANSSGNTAVFCGGDATADSGPYTVASSATYFSNAWTTISNSTLDASIYLNSNGIVFARSLEQVQKVFLAQALYLASTFSSSIASQLVGATPTVYRTNTLRVATNTFADGGDIALIAGDSEGLKTQLPSGDSVENTGSHLAFVESASSDAGTPTFQMHETLAQESSVLLHVSGDVASSSTLLGSTEVWDGASSRRFGNHYSFRSAIKEVTARSGSTAATLRMTPGEVIPRTTLWSSAALAISPRDSLVALVDDDSNSKRFVVPMWRKLKPLGSYGTTITVKDADNSNETLATAFGLNFDFNDFALHQAARAITHSGDSTKSILWRYHRLGAEGNAAQVRYVYPTSANQTLSVTTDTRTDDKVKVEVNLPSGNAKTGYTIRASSKLGLVAEQVGALHRLTYILGLSIASATRQTRLNYNAELVNFVVGEVVTGNTSGASGTVASITDNGTAGILVLTGVTGIFQSGETLKVGVTNKATADGTQYQRVMLTLTAPVVGMTSHGLNIGQSIYVSGSGNFVSGLKTITAATGLTLEYAENGVDGTATNIGTISNDVAPVTLTGASPAIAIGDILTITSASGINSNWEKTLRIDSVGPQFITGLVEGFAGVASLVPSWETLNDVLAFSIYGLTANTALAISTAVNAIAESPVKATLLGSGSGAISLSTLNEQNAANYWFNLSDGINFVKTTISPALLTGDYQLELKEPIASGLSGSGSDWVNEEVRLVPTSSATLVRWLSASAITGLGNACEIKLSSGGKKVQISSLTSGSAGSIQIQGGLANEAAAVVVGSTEEVASSYAVSVIPAADAEGLSGGMWVSVNNTISMPKNVLGTGTVLDSLQTDGTFTVSAATTYSTSSPAVLSKTWNVTKQGDFVCLSHRMVNSSDIASITAKEGDWLRIKSATSVNVGQLNSLNRGIFRIVRVQDDALIKAIWIENSNAIEEFGDCDLHFYSFDSLMPGDVLSISTDLWGSENKGKWTIVDVGDGFTDNTKFKVDVTTRSPSEINTPRAPLSASEAKLVQVLEASPTRLVKKIQTISPNGTQFLDVKFTTNEGWELMSEGAGTVIRALGKLGFDSDSVIGADAYRYSVGLIGEANRVLYGDSTDSASYPGVIAAGANVNISGPIVKRIQVGLSLRIRSGISTADIANRVRSVVASVVNSSGVGQSIAISDLVSAASKVNGVLAVSVTSPTYTSANDLIPVQPQEKPLVINLEQDVLLSFAGQ